MVAGVGGKARAVVTARPAMPDLHLHGWLHAKKNTRDFRWCSPDAAAKGRLGLLKAYCVCVWGGRTSGELAEIGKEAGLYIISLL